MISISTQFSETAVRELTAGLRDGSLGTVIGGGPGTPTLGPKAFLQVPYDCTITGWTMAADQPGSAQVIVKHCAASAFPNAVSIVAGAPPTLTSQQSAESTTLAGWATKLAQGDWIQFDLASISTCQRLILRLAVLRS